MVELQIKRVVSIVQVIGASSCSIMESHDPDFVFILIQCSVLRERSGPSLLEAS